MAIGDRFQIIDTQYYLGQGILNIYYYKATAGSAANAQNCVAGWIAGPLPEILAIQDVDMEHNAFTCINLDDPTDFFVDFPTSGNIGTYTGTHPLAAWAAFSFMYHRATRACRNGWKRFAGIDEEVVAGNEIVPGFLSTVNALATALGTTIDGFGNQYIPRIVRKNAVPALSEDFGVTSVSFRGYTTQNTRKPGRGM